MHCGGVDHPGVQINQTFLIQPDMQSFKYSVKRALVSPITEPLIHRRPGAEALRQVAPGGSGTEDPEDAVEHQPIITSRPAHLLLWGNQILDQLPGCIGEFVAPCHVGPSQSWRRFYPHRLFVQNLEIAGQKSPNQPKLRKSICATFSSSHSHHPRGNEPPQN